MNIFLREMKAHRKSLIIWCIAILAMVAASMSKFNAASATGQSMNELIAQMPKAIQAVLGTGTFDLSKASGFYGVLFLYLVVMGTIHAGMLGATIISKEERDKTVEFLLVKPASRSRIITAKLLAAFANILIFNLTTLAASVWIVGAYSKGEPINQDIAVLMLALLILQVIYLLIGTGIASVSKKAKTAVGFSTAVLLFTFILSMVIDMNSKLEKLKYLTPFKYYEAKSLMYGGGFEPVFLIISLLLAAVLLSVTYTVYTRKDMNL